ncbi:MAG: ABC transporter ATP-binding protein [Cellulosilyticaceae bacterium]
MNQIITTDNLTKIYGTFKGAKEVTAIKDINLSIKKGDFVGIMGPSGSGKTTLLNILSGLDKATSGTIEIEKSNMTKMSKDELILYRRKNIGYIFQDFNLMDSLTVKENIGLPLILDHIAPKIIDEKVNTLMKFFDIEDLSDKYPYHISGGQKQRVAAARALVNDPVVCFADEPTGNLDSKSSKNVMNMLTKMNKEKMATILMVTHDAFAASYCKRIIFIKDGEIHFEIKSSGDRKEFFDKILEAQSILGGE